MKRLPGRALHWEENVPGGTALGTYFEFTSCAVRKEKG